MPKTTLGRLPRDPGFGKIIAPGAELGSGERQFLFLNLARNFLLDGQSVPLRHTRKFPLAELHWDKTF